jgi:tetratricopeptide (TPR) repeat protein
MTRRLLSLALLLVFFGMLSAPAAGADGVAADTPNAGEGSANAQRRYAEAAALFRAGKYERAIRLFLEADRLAPSAALAFNVARAYEKLGNTARALEYYRHYLRRDPNGSGARRAASRVSELQAKLEQRGVQQLTVRSSPEGAAITLDQTSLGVTPWTGELAPGNHTLEVSHEGYAKAVRVVTVSAERALDLDITLSRTVEAATLTSAAPDPRHEPSFRERAGLWPFVALGASAVSLGIAGAFELERSDSEAAARGSRTQLDYAAHRDDAENSQTTARVFAGAGGGLLLIGGVLLGIALLDDDADDPSPKERAKAGFNCSLSECAVHYVERF